MAFGSHDTQILSLIIEAEDHATEKLKAVGESLAKLSEYVIGYEIVRGAIEGIEELGKGIIETNAVMQQLQQTFTAIYHSAGEAQQAVNWITQFGMQAPFTTQDIMRAGVAISSIGQDITEVLPALGNLAAVMGTTMPIASQALVDAFEGRFQMMQRDLHVTKEELQSFGLVIEGNGHVVQSTLIPAFEAFVAKNYPQGMKLQMDTLQGVWSNFIDQFQLVERELGKNTFKVLQQDLSGITTWLQQNQGRIAQFASVLSEDLGGAARSVGQALHDLMDVLPTVAVGMTGAWNAISGVVDIAAGSIHAAVSDIANFLKAYVLPAVYEALGTLILWWRRHGADVVTILTDLQANIRSWADIVSGLFIQFFTVLKDVASFAWGAIEVIFGTAMQNIDGNSARWRAMQLDGWTTMQTSIVAAVNHMFEAVMDLALQPDLPNAFATLGRLMADALIGAVSLIPKGIGLIFNAVEALINSAMAKFREFRVSIPMGPFGQTITIAPFGDVPQFHRDFAAEQGSIWGTFQKSIDRLMTPPTPTASQQAQQNALIASLNASWEARSQSLQDDIMRNAGYVQQAVGLATSRTGDRPGQVVWVRPGDTGIASSFQYSGSSAQIVGQQAIDKLLAGWQDDLKKKFSAVDSGAKGLGPLPGPGGLPVYGYSPSADAAQIKAAADRALKDARDQFHIDLNNSDFVAANKDIALILKDMVPLLGFDAKDKVLENQNLLKEIRDATKGTHAAITNNWRIFTPFQTAGEGQTIAAYGLPATQTTAARTIAALERLVAQQEAKLRQDEQTISLLQQQLSQEGATARNTAGMANSLERIARDAGKPAQQADPRTAKGLVTIGR